MKVFVLNEVGEVVLEVHVPRDIHNTAELVIAPGNGEAGSVRLALLDATHFVEAIGERA